MKHLALLLIVIGMVACQNQDPMKNITPPEHEPQNLPDKQELLSNKHLEAFLDLEHSRMDEIFLNKEKGKGKDEILLEEISIEEGTKTVYKYTVFPDSTNPVQLFFEDAARHQLLYVQIEGDACVFSSKEGISLGMSLSELVQLNNGEEVKFYGFGWDNGGMIVLDSTSNTQAYLSLPSDYTGNELMGDGIFSSNDPITIKINPRVNLIKVYKQ